MSQSIQDRKATLRHLLQKSQMFNHYIKNQQALNTILSINQARKQKVLQFGKCQIKLPEKSKLIPQPRFHCNKLMILTKSKKQAQRLKQKYDYLQSIKTSQVIDLTSQPNPHINTGSTDYRRYLKQQCANKPILTPHRSQTPKQNISKPNVELYTEHSAELKAILQRQKQRMLFNKNRSNSAKARDKIDLLLKHGCSIQQRGMMNNSKSRLEKNRSSLENKQGNQLLANNDRQAGTYSSFSSIPQTPNDQTRVNTIQQTFLNHTFSTFSRNQASQMLIRNQIMQSQHPPDYQKRSTSFSVKKPQFQSQTQSQTPSLLINKNFQQSQQEQKKNQIIFRKELYKTYNRAFVPPPKISAKGYAIYELKKQGFKETGKIIHALNGKMAQQVASLTKIMTCLIVIQLSQKYNYNLSEEIAQIGKFQSSISGTSAEIKPGEIYTIQQLLHGLMLPSGNDASLALGVWGGKVLIQNQAGCPTSRTQDNSQNSTPSLQTKNHTKKDYVARFVEQMNQKAKSLQMTRTRYANTHGLVNPENKSCAIDMVLLCEYAISNRKFSSIVSTRTYSSQIKLKKKQPAANNTSQFNILQTRQISYINTHMLLHKRPSEYIGIKTGVTTAAGPCLASCIHNKQTDRKFIIVVLGCKTMAMRFKETEVLKRWLYKQENIPIKWKRSSAKQKEGSSRDGQSELRSEVEDEESGSGEELGCQGKWED